MIRVMKKTIMITGASRGIGAAAAKRFARENVKLILLCHEQKEKLKELADSLSSESVEVKTYAGDLSDPAFVKSLAPETDEMDLLINNAGISHVGLLQDMAYEEWRHVLSVNLDSAFLMTKAVLPGMIRRKNGRIINISSVWGSAGASMEAAYSASKGGLDALTKALAKELAPSGIPVNAIAFGCVDTEMNAHLTAEEKALLSEEIPIGRFCTPEEAAEMIFLVSKAPAYLTGQVIAFTGGWVL